MTNIPDNQESKELEQKGDLSMQFELDACNDALTTARIVLIENNYPDKPFLDDGIKNVIEDARKLREQLTTTQQALDSAVKALEDARNFVVISTGVHRNIVLEKIESALASIKE